MLRSYAHTRYDNGCTGHKEFHPTDTRTDMIPTHVSTNALRGANNDARVDATTVYDTIHGGGRHR
jgi:hypothetical protein